MKLALFGAVSALTLLAGAAHAQTTVTGYIGGGYSYSNTPGHGTDTFSDGADTFTDSSHTDSIYVEGAISVPVTSLIGAQVDLGYVNSSVAGHETFNDGEVTTTAVSTDNIGGHADSTIATGHLFARTDKFLAGAFVGEEDLGDTRLIGGGVEGQYYLDRLTLGASLGAAKNDGFFEGGEKPTVIAGRVDLRYFVTHDLSLGVNAGYLHASDSFNDAGEHFSETGPNLFTVGASAEWKPVWAPITFTAAYEYGRENGRETFIDEGAETDREYLTGNSLKVGVRWTFGGSLFDRDRHGASLNSFQKAFGDEFGVSAPVFDGA